MMTVIENSGVLRLYYKILSGSWRDVSHNHLTNAYNVTLNDNANLSIRKDEDEDILITVTYSNKEIGCGILAMEDHYTDKQKHKLYKMIKKAYKADTKGYYLRKKSKWPEGGFEHNRVEVTLWNIL